MWNLCGVVVFNGPMVNWRRGWGQSVMKLLWCSGLTWIYVQLEEGWGVSLSWKLFSVMVFQRSMLDWLGGPLAKVGLSAKFALIYVSCFGVVVLHGSIVNWRWGVNLPWIHATPLHLPCQSTIDPCYTVTPQQSALGICAWCSVWNLCGVVVFHGSMVNWRREDQSVMKIVWCNSLPGIHAQMMRGSIGKSRFICQIWAHLWFMLCLTEGLLILHMKDLNNNITV